MNPEIPNELIKIIKTKQNLFYNLNLGANKEMVDVKQ